MSYETFRRPALGALVLLSAFALPFFVPAYARDWKPTPAKQAVDYSIIVDARPGGELVQILWFVPQFIDVGGTNSPEASKLLDEYIFIAVVRGKMGIGGNVVFDENATIKARDGNGTALKLLQGDDIPPTAAGVVTTAGGVIRQMLGPLGEGMHFFVFENGGVHTCKKGQLVVSYAGEDYTYDTPFPGCTAQ
jgi:hypothetical protein